MILKSQIKVLLFVILLLFSSTFLLMMIRENNKLPSISIYLVSEEDRNGYLEKDINSILLESKPLITNKEIISYKWSENKITLKSDFDIKKELSNRKFNITSSGIPFVLLCNDEAIYTGVFWTLTSSLISPDCPIFIVESITQNNEYWIRYEHDGTDLRHNENLKNVLDELNMLKN